MASQIEQSAKPSQAASSENDEVTKRVFEGNKNSSMNAQCSGEAGYVTAYSSHSNIPVTLPATQFSYSSYLNGFPPAPSPYTSNATADMSRMYYVSQNNGPMGIAWYPYQVTNPAPSNASIGYGYYYSVPEYMPTMSTHYTEATLSSDTTSSNGSWENMVRDQATERDTYRPCGESSCPACGFTEYCDRNFKLGIGNNSTFYLVNYSSQTSAFVSADARHFGFQNPFAQIVRTSKYFLGVFNFPSRLCFVEITPRNIRFSGNAMTYLIDEAGTRTCMDSFPLLHELTSCIDKWMTRCQSYAVLQNFDTPDEHIKVTNGLVQFTANSKKLDQVFLTIDKTKVNAKLGDHSYIFLSTPVGNAQIRGSVHFNGKELTIRFGTQYVRLNGNGKISLRLARRKDSKTKPSDD